MAYNPNLPAGQATMANSAPVVVASNQSTLPVSQQDTRASISISANSTSSGQCTSPGGAGSFVIQLTGTWSATLQAQFTIDGTNWVNVNSSTQMQTLTTGGLIPSANITTNGIYIVHAPGVVGARVITTAYTSGTVTGTASLIPTVGMVGLTAGNSTPTYLSRVIAATNLGTSIYSGSIAATAVAAKTTTGNLYGFTLHNPNAAISYVQFFNATTANVTVGTTTPAMSVAIPANGALEFSTALGISFSTAISLAATTTRTGSTAPSSTVDVNVFYG